MTFEHEVIISDAGYEGAYVYVVGHGNATIPQTYDIWLHDNIGWPITTWEFEMLSINRYKFKFRKLEHALLFKLTLG